MSDGINDDLIRLRSKDYWSWLTRQEESLATAIAYIEAQQERYTAALADKNWNKANDSIFEVEATKLAIRNLDPRYFGASYATNNSP